MSSRAIAPATLVALSAAFAFAPVYAACAFGIALGLAVLAWFVGLIVGG